MLAIPISSPGGHGERELWAAAMVIAEPAATSAQTSRKMIIGRLH